MKRGLTAIVAMVGTLTLAGCAILPRPTATPVPATATAQRPSPTSTVAPTATPRPPTATRTSPPPTATATPLSPTPTSPPPTATVPPPTKTPSPAPATTEATIHVFRAEPEVTDPGDTITLSWRWSGGRDATIYHLFPTGQLSEPFWQVGPTGSLQYTISSERRNWDGFVLYVHNEDGVVAQETVQIELRCPDVWFFSPAPDICPASPVLVTDGAEEHFERGTMLWVSAQDLIYVLFDDGQQRGWSAYEDEWDEGEPTADPAIEPPPGLYQPVRGFGLVWREQTMVRERLGWAVDQERGYQTMVQRTSHVRYPVLYIRALDGGVWQLGPNGSAWQHLPPQ